MCTIIKVKRKITDDPVDCLIIECKKKKLLGADIIELSDEKSSEPPQNKNNRSPHLKQILKYVGSANNEVCELFKKLWSRLFIKKFCKNFLLKLNKT